jgi:hypothetical protein
VNFSNGELDRVRRNTSPELLAQIDRKIEENIRLYSTHPKEVIARRIDELDREWSVERILQTNASGLALTGVILGLTVSKKWLVLSGAVLGFLLQHAVQGWCPPVPLLRRLGVRTRGEIDREKYALKALRGDFQSIKPSETATASIEEVLQAVRA